MAGVTESRGRTDLARKVELSFDVTDALPAEATGGSTVRIAGWAYLPAPEALPASSPRAMVLLAGGSYDKRYHDAHIPGYSGYSAAEHLAALLDKLVD